MVLGMAELTDYWAEKYHHLHPVVSEGVHADIQRKITTIDIPERVVITLVENNRYVTLRFPDEVLTLHTSEAVEYLNRTLPEW